MPLEPCEKTLTVFEDITENSGLPAYDGMTHGAAWGDYDGDGQPLSNGMHTLYKWAGICAGARQDVAGGRPMNNTALAPAR